MAKNGLQRLFESELFDANLALEYLYKYHDQVGIQFAILTRLGKMPQTRIDFILPQLCHLAVCNEKTASIENFILQQCQAHLHSAVFTMWYLENYLSDFRGVKDSILYSKAARILGDLQRVIFQEQAPTQESLPGLAPNLLALGTMMAGAIYSEATDKLRPLIMTEARRGSTIKKKSVRPIRHATETESTQQFSLKNYLIKAVTPPAFMMLSSTPNTAHAVPLYYYAEMQLVMSLINISVRLVTVPKRDIVVICGSLDCPIDVHRRGKNSDGTRNLSNA